MPRDPLAAVAERFAPEPSNFFDPAAGASILARYGNARRSRESAQELGDAISRNRQVREMTGVDALSPYEQRRQQEAIEDWDRKDLERSEERKALAREGEFLKTLGSIDPKAKDYPALRTKLLQEMPPALLETQGIKAILENHDTIAREQRSMEEKDRYREEGWAQSRRSAIERATRRAAEAGLPPEKFPRDPITGEVDADELMFMAGNFKRDAAEATKIAGEERRNAEYDRRRENMDAAKLAEAVRKQPVGKDIEASLGNESVFPTQMSALRRNNPKLDDTKLKAKFPKEYGDAKEYDRAQLEKELGSAFNRPNVEDYVNLVPGLNAEQKELRRKVWQAANAAFGDAAPAASSPAPAADKFVVGKKYRDGKGNVRTYKGDGKWE